VNFSVRFSSGRFEDTALIEVSHTKSPEREKFPALPSCRSSDIALIKVSGALFRVTECSFFGTFTVTGAGILPTLKILNRSFCQVSELF
jgi:hypothetical protein